MNPPPDARWVGFKEIRFAELADDFDEALNFIRASFPNTHFIFNKRNAEAVSQSSWHKNEPKEDVVNMVKTMDERFSMYAQKNPENTFISNHERTISDYRYLKTFFDQCNEPFEEKLIEKILSQPLTH